MFHKNECTRSFGGCRCDSLETILDGPHPRRGALKYVPACLICIRRPVFSFSKLKCQVEYTICTLKCTPKCAYVRKNLKSNYFLIDGFSWFSSAIPYVGCEILQRNTFSEAFFHDFFPGACVTPLMFMRFLCCNPLFRALRMRKPIL